MLNFCDSIKLLDLDSDILEIHTYFDICLILHFRCPRVHLYWLTLPFALKLASIHPQEQGDL